MKILKNTLSETRPVSSKVDTWYWTNTRYFPNKCMRKTLNERIGKLILYIIAYDRLNNSSTKWCLLWHCIVGRWASPSSNIYLSSNNSSYFPHFLSFFNNVQDYECVKWKSTIPLWAQKQQINVQEYTKCSVT